MRRISFISLIVCCAASTAFTQDPPPSPQEPAAPAAAAGASAARPGVTPPSQDPQPYDKVITKEAKTKKGIFQVHQIKEKYYYEVPKAELNKVFLWNTEIAKTALGVGYGGQPLTERVIRWELTGNKVHLREVNYDVVAAPDTPISLAVQAANNDAIIMTFPVAAFNKDGDPVIEVTRLFNTDVQEIGARQRLGATSLDASRSSIDRISPYPENIEAEATMTYTRMPTPPGGTSTPTVSSGSQMRPGSATIVLHHSMVKLPEKPMLPRIYDDRIGYFSESKMDYGRDEHRAPRVRYIARWRLEKKNPSAEVSEVVKPIVYYIDAATPTKWVEWMKKGVEDWQPAFEAAGFKNAIIAKEVPKNDPDFAMEDVRNSVIRWLPSTTENAMGPNIHDPRTGEILNAPIQFYHNIMNLQRSWYFLQAGPLDPRAQKLPLPDDLMGRLLEFVVAHEVGHTLGLQHNMKASSMYPAEKVHDKEWVAKMGHCPSIMDYSRFNYVAQPEDGIAVENLVPRIGPYDVYAIKWGYSPIPSAKSSDDEKETLNKWLLEQDRTPWLRFSSARSSGSDPGELTEAVGDADAIASSTDGLKNLKRVAKMLVPATTAKAGENYEDLSELYVRMLSQWTLEMNHVAAIVGGVDGHEKHVGQEGPLYVAVPKARQEAAVKFLAENAFATPTWAVDKSLLRLIEPAGALNRIRGAQSSVLNNLLSTARFARLVEQEAVDGGATYSPADLVTAVRKAIWKELDAPQVKVDAFRRNLQHAYLDLSNGKVNSTSSPATNVPPELAGMLVSSSDEKPMYRTELRSLNASVVAALVKTTDRETRAHLEGVRDQIAKILDPKFAATSNSNSGVVIRIGLDGVEVPGQTCWPDYLIQ
jgi:hypothetical protein